jgi:hypothetical protein
MGLSGAVLSEDPYGDGGIGKQDEAECVERAGELTPYSSAALHRGAIFPLGVRSYTELQISRFYKLGPPLSAPVFPLLFVVHRSAGVLLAC